MSIPRAEMGGELSPDDVMKFENDAKDLKEAEEKLGMEGKLVGRLKYGLDPAAMMVMRETAPQAERIAHDLGADKESIWPLIKQLHEQGPWKLADRLSKAEDAEIKTYLVLAAACHESRGGYDQAGYMKDRKRVIEDLSTFTADKFDARRNELIETAAVEKEEVRDIDGKRVTIPISEGDAALALAVRGFKGVVTKAGEMRFAQTAEIPDEILKEQGLVPGFGETYDPGANGFVRIALDDPRMEKGARTVWVHEDEKGKPIADMAPGAKRIAPGFVLTYANEELGVDMVAKAIARQESRSKE